MNNLVELDNLYFVIENVLEFLATFVITMTDQFLTFLLKQIYDIYGVSTIFFVILLLFLWTFYVKYLEKILYKNKLSLTVLPIDYLINNPYVACYL